MRKGRRYIGAIVMLSIHDRPTSLIISIYVKEMEYLKVLFYHKKQTLLFK